VIKEINLRIDEPMVASSENYTLTVLHNRISVSARSQRGVLWAWETLQQTLRLATYSDCWLATGVPLSITDGPHFAHRALSIDTVREAHSMAFLSRLLHVMAAAKLNVLHWRIHDEVTIVEALRRMTEANNEGKNMAMAGSLYSAEEAREVVALASELGIAVVPELPLPAMRLDPARVQSAPTFTLDFDFTTNVTEDSVESVENLVRYVSELRALFKHTRVYFGVAEHTERCRDSKQLQ
jgi:N-acetyl-beta-hexosaminidase